MDLERLTFTQTSIVFYIYLSGKHFLTTLMKALLVCCFFTLASLNAFTQGTSTQRSQWLVDVIFRLETQVEGTNADMKRIRAEIQKCDATIATSESIISLAQQRGSTEAEKVARAALQKAQDAKQKNVSSLIAASEYLKKLQGIRDYVKTGAGDAALKLEQFKLDNQTDEWIKAKDEQIQQRLVEPCLLCDKLSTSLKTNAPPPLPGKTFNELKPGDVLLISKETAKRDTSVIASNFNSETVNKIHQEIGSMVNEALTLPSKAINAADNFISSTDASQASHTLIYLKTLNGQKMFLDNVPGRGPTIISEQEYIYLYGKRGTEVAQPIKAMDGDRLYEAARTLADEQLKVQVQNNQTWYSKITGTNYGMVGSDMVCSESSRWVLVKAGMQILPEADDKQIRVFGTKYGVGYSPADFVKSNYFIVTPLSGVPKTP